MPDKNDVQNVHRQPAHKLTTTTPLTNRCCVYWVLHWRHNDVIIGHSVFSTQEKYLITHLYAWSIVMEHAKNYEIRCKIS